MFLKKPKKKNFIIRYLCLFLSLFISFRYESFVKASSIQQERSYIQDQNKLQQNTNLKLTRLAPETVKLDSCNKA